jgi:hypothetical protein
MERLASKEPIMSTSDSRPTTRQTIVLALMGALFWFVAALVVRWTAADWAGRDGATMLVFVLIVIATLPALFLGARVAGVGRDQFLAVGAIMVGVATLLDSVALTWFRPLYGTDPAIVLAGAAAIFWGVGVALVLGIVLQRP